MKLIIRITFFVNHLSTISFDSCKVINYRKHCGDIPYEEGQEVFHYVTKSDVERWAKKIITE